MTEEYLDGSGEAECGEMTEQSTTSIQDVITAILNNINQDKMTLFASLQEHPLLQKAVDAARNGQPERFLYALPYPLERVTDGLLQTVLPGKPKAHFIMKRYKFLNTHFQGIIQRREGMICSGDKSSTILYCLLQYYLTGKEVVFDPDEPYTFGHPTTVFTTHREIVEFFDGLYELYYGNPESYLHSMKIIMENSDV